MYMVLHNTNNQTVVISNSPSFSKAKTAPTRGKLELETGILAADIGAPVITTAPVKPQIILREEAAPVVTPPAEKKTPKSPGLSSPDTKRSQVDTFSASITGANSRSAVDAYEKLCNDRERAAYERGDISEDQWQAMQAAKAPTQNKYGPFSVEAKYTPLVAEVTEAPKAREIVKLPKAQAQATSVATMLRSSARDTATARVLEPGQVSFHIPTQLKAISSPATQRPVIKEASLIAESVAEKPVNEVIKPVIEKPAKTVTEPVVKKKGFFSKIASGVKSFFGRFGKSTKVAKTPLKGGQRRGFARSRRAPKTYTQAVTASTWGAGKNIYATG